MSEILVDVQVSDLPIEDEHKALYQRQPDIIGKFFERNEMSVYSYTSIPGLAVGDYVIVPFGVKNRKRLGKVVALTSPQREKELRQHVPFFKEIESIFRP